MYRQRFGLTGHPLPHRVTCQITTPDRTEPPRRARAGTHGAPRRSRAVTCLGNQSFDAKAGSLLGMFDFKQERSGRLFLDPATGQVVGGDAE